MTILVYAETVVLALLAFLVAGLLRSHAEILRAVRVYANDESDTTVGTDHDPMKTTGVIDALGISGTTLGGDPVNLPLWSAGDENSLLAFISTGCLGCEPFWDAFKRDDLVLPANTRLLVIAKSVTEESRPRLRRLAPERHEIVLSSSAWKHYNVPVSPYFVFIRGADAKVMGEGTARSWAQVLALMRQGADEHEFESAIAAGSQRTQPSHVRVHDEAAVGADE